MPNKWFHSLQIAFTYIGTVVGAGFASGREIIEFFVQYGIQGFIGILIAALLFVWAGTRIMLIAHKIKASSYQDISTYLFGKTAGTLFNGILLTILLGTTSVMLAASGSIFQESFQLPAQVGIWLTMCCIYLITIRGLNAIYSVNSLFVPLLIMFTVVVFFFHQPWKAENLSLSTIKLEHSWFWISSPLYYVSLNLALTQSVLVPIGRETKEKASLIWGGLFGGLGIGLLLLLAYSSMAGHIPSILKMEMPMIYLLVDMGKWFALLFAILVYAEIFSSLVANVFGLVEQVKRFFQVSPHVIILVILAGAYLISFVGFSSLLSLLYPLFGQVVVIFLLMLGFRQWTER
ncbi:YkvI family membrane protein [Brevibacillus ginsengisoli]|uniref:YkvI family membrane protein n=1 Tax=Brevibacillus ginsengisoli TaxID=363854 RepID=UPI003CF0C8DB